MTALGQPRTQPRAQPRTMSAIEAITNLVAGYALAVLAQLVVFPVFGLSVTPAQTLQIGVVFTALSIVRSDALRRLFNALQTPVAPWR
ncbi:MAG: hypothetical protein AAFV96_11775 [Pseudomonadota bacterium]